MAGVVLANITKIYENPGGQEVRAVADFNLTIEEGELVVIVGPSGCGKTTLLRLIAGLEPITRGTISIGGRVVNDLPPGDRDVAMVFQHYALYPHMSVHENIAFGLKIRKYPRAEVEARVHEAARMLGLDTCLDRTPDTLSGGQRQRVALGRAIARQPKVCLLDEPLSNLDARMRVQIRTEIFRLHKRLAMTMVYVTHDQAEALALGDRIAVMKDGVVQQVDKPLAVYHRPANMFVAGFIGASPVNFFSGTLSKTGNALSFEEEGGSPTEPTNRITLRLGDQTSPELDRFLGQKIVVGIRPENILVKDEVRKGDAAQVVQAELDAIELLGAETNLYLSSAAHSFVARVRGNTTMIPAQRVSVEFEMDHAHFFDPATEQRIV